MCFWSCVNSCSTHLADNVFHIFRFISQNVIYSFRWYSNIFSNFLQFQLASPPRWYCALFNFWVGDTSLLTITQISTKCERKTWKGGKTKNWLKRGERSNNTYLTHVCSLPWSLDMLEIVDKTRAFCKNCCFYQR